MLKPNSNVDVFVTNIEKQTIENNNYRQVIFTSVHQQLVLMNIGPGEDIEFEVHPDGDQFIRIEQGTCMLITGANRESQYSLTDGVSAIIPAGTWHQIVNTSESTPLKLYTIYSPPEHPANHIDKFRPSTKHHSAQNKIEYRKRQMY